MGAGTQEFVKTEPHPYLRKLCLACRLEEMLEFSDLLVQRPCQGAWLPPTAGPAHMLTPPWLLPSPVHFSAVYSEGLFLLAARLCILRIPRNLKRKLPLPIPLFSGGCTMMIGHADNVWNFVYANFVKTSVVDRGVGSVVEHWSST